MAVGPLRAGRCGGGDQRVEHLLRGVVEQRQDALLLVGEVLVEGRLGHPGLATDRLRAGLGVSQAREDRGGGLEEPLLLDLQPDLERRSMATARDRRLGIDRIGHGAQCR